MSGTDRSEIKQLVRDLRVEAVGYNRQWLNWLGVASGSGAVALLSFAANLPDPDYALRALLPAISAFAAGICFAGLAVLTAPFKIGAAERHYGAAFNRDELNDAIRSVPFMVSAPPRLAAEHNAPRDTLISQHDQFHNNAEAAWIQHVHWKNVQRLFLMLSALGFIVGLCVPLVHVATDGSFVPPAKLNSPAAQSSLLQGAPAR